MFTQKEEIKWLCPQCGSQNTKTVDSRVSVKEEPDCRKQILDTTFFQMTCPQCGQKEYYLGPLFYVDEEAKQMIAMGAVPAFEKEKENYLALGYAVRSVPGIVELCEKILIRQAGLDDRIVELVKAADTVLLKGQEFDEMLYAPDEDAVYIELIKDGASAGRLPFLDAVYDDMQERFGALLQNDYDDETIIDLKWAAEFFLEHYQNEK